MKKISFSLLLIVIFSSQEKIQIDALNNTSKKRLSYGLYNEAYVSNILLRTNDEFKRLQTPKSKKDIEISNLKEYSSSISIALACTIVLMIVILFVNISSKEERKAIQNKNRILKNSINKKNILLKEIHHRVKNSLQLVISLLYIQSKEKDTDIDDFFENSQNRIKSMALIHENLYQTNDFAKVDIQDYVFRLKESIEISHTHPKKKIKLQIDIDEIYLDIEMAVPLGLIINELISNSYKHAFEKRKNGNIALRLKQTNKTEHHLEIYDNGIGYGTNIVKGRSLGLELVKQLVSQMNGTLQVKNDLGTQYNIQF